MLVWTYVEVIVASYSFQLVRHICVTFIYLLYSTVNEKSRVVNNFFQLFFGFQKLLADLRPSARPSGFISEAYDRYSSRTSVAAFITALPVQYSVCWQRGQVLF